LSVGTKPGTMKIYLYISGNDSLYLNELWDITLRNNWESTPLVNYIDVYVYFYVYTYNVYSTFNVRVNTISLAFLVIIILYCQPQVFLYIHGNCIFYMNFKSQNIHFIYFCLLFNEKVVLEKVSIISFCNVTCDRKILCEPVYMSE